VVVEVVLVLVLGLLVVLVAVVVIQVNQQDLEHLVKEILVDPDKDLVDPAAVVVPEQQVLLGLH
jgi:hypothetical protein